MKLLICAVIPMVALLSRAADGQLSVVTDGNVPSAPLLNNGAAVDEVVVESSLYIKPKPKNSLRRTRRALPLPVALQMSSLLEHKRVKRQPQRRGPNRNNLAAQQPQQEYGQSQAAANAAANAQYQNPQRGEYGQSAANALSQAFNAQGPAGSFGAAAAGSVTQAHNTNPFGTQNTAGASHSQSYVLPNGATINFGAANTFANGPAGNNANSRGSAVAVQQG